MKILSITPDFQHPEVPGSHRHYHFIKELSKRHDITLFTLVQKPVPPAARAEVSSLTTRIVCFDISSPPQGSAIAKFFFRRNVIQEMRHSLRRLLCEEAFDVVLFHGKMLSSLTLEINIPTVVDFCDATAARIRSQMRFEGPSSLPKRLLQYLDARINEKRLLTKSIHTAFISVRDRNATIGARSDSTVIPNGVDLEFWNPTDDRREPKTLALTGVMNYRPNEDAALMLINKIMPQIRTQIPNPHLLLIGRGPTAAMRKAASSAEDVTITGVVDDVRPWMERAEVFVAPIQFASGMQNKVLEAMAMRLPVVTTSVVAEGVESERTNGPPLIVADDARAFSEAVIRLLDDPAERARLGELGLEYVRQQFSWIASAKKFEALCHAAISQARDPV